MKLKKCLCGEEPKIIKERKCYGHGEFPLVAYVKCDNCRLHTPEFIIDDFYGCTDTEDTAIEYWNKLMSTPRDFIEYKIFNKPINYRSITEEEFDKLLWSMKSIDLLVIMRYKYYGDKDWTEYDIQRIYSDEESWIWEYDWEETQQEIEILGIIDNSSISIHAYEIYEYLKSQPQRVENLEEEMKRQAIERMIHNETT